MREKAERANVEEGGRLVDYGKESQISGFQILGNCPKRKSIFGTDTGCQYFIWSNKGNNKNKSKFNYGPPSQAFQERITIRIFAFKH